MRNQDIKDQVGVIEVSQAAEFNFTRKQLYDFLKENEYERVGPGMYVSPDEFVDELQVLCKRCPCGVISHDEALYHYSLVDREPMFHTITTYSGYNAARLSKSGYKVYYVDKQFLELGKQMVIDNYGNEIPMYDLERTIVDMVRCRSKFEIQDYTTALKTYAGLKEKNLANLFKYAKVFRVEKIIRGYLEVLL